MIEVSENDFIQGVGLSDGGIVTVVYVGGGKEQQVYNKPVEIAIREISYSAFLDRFKVESLVAIESSTDTLVKVLEKKIESKGRDKKVIKLDDPKLREGLEYYDSKGLLLNGDTPDSLLADGTPDEQ